MRVAFAFVVCALLVAEAYCASAVAQIRGMFNYTGVLGGQVTFVQVVSVEQECLPAAAEFASSC